ncbi:MAG TPA: hypothetical protein VGE63_01165 [Candidatus Paceibacterota bacterium]
MKNLFVAYQENSNITRYAHEVLAFVPKDVQVTKLIFPEETLLDEMVEPLRQLLLSTKGPTLYFSDFKCLRGAQLGKLVEEEFKLAVDAGLETLTPLNTAMIKQIGDIFQKYSFEKILTNISPWCIKSPKTICIVEQYLNSYLLLVKDEGLYSFKDLREMKDSRGAFPKVIKGYMRNIYPKAGIVLTETFEEAVEKVGTNPDALIVGGRDLDVLTNCWSMEGWKYNAKLLMIPYEITVSHLIEKGAWGFSLDGEELFKRIMKDHTFD